MWSGIGGVASVGGEPGPELLIIASVDLDLLASAVALGPHSRGDVSEPGYLRKNP